MLTRAESNELLSKVDELIVAWQNYVADVKSGAMSQHGAQALVLELTEKLQHFIKEDLT